MRARHRVRHSAAARAIGGIVRRTTIGRAIGGIWEWLGYELDGEVEADDAPVFQGLGIYARPAEGDRAEALLLAVGAAAQHGAIAALRNEDARRRYVEAFGEPAPGEVAIFPSSGTSRVLLQADGTILVEGEAIKARSSGGTTKRVAFLEELDALRTYVAAQFASPAGHTHTDSAGGQTSVCTPIPAPTVIPPAVVGTSKFEAE